MALALPAASVPPTSVQTTSPNQRPVHAARAPGRSRVARTIAGTVVTSSSSMMRGLVSAMYARIVSAVAAPRRRTRRRARSATPVAGAGPVGDGRPGRVVARDGQAGQHRPDDRAEREVERLGPLGELGQDLQPADDDLDREQDRRPRPRAGRVVGWSRCVRQATTAMADDDQPDDRRDPAMQDVGRVASVSGGNSVPPMSGQSGKTSADVGRRHVRSEQQQREGRGRAEGDEQGEPLARAATAHARRVAGPDGEEDEQRRRASSPRRGGR